MDLQNILSDERKRKELSHKNCGVGVLLMFSCMRPHKNCPGKTSLHKNWAHAGRKKNSTNPLSTLQVKLAGYRFGYAVRRPLLPHGR